MLFLDRAILDLAMLIEFGGSLAVTLACARGLHALVHGMVRGRGRRASIVSARLLVADGIIAALGFKTAATLLRTIELRTFEAMLAFCVILALRTLIKRTLAWEVKHLRSRMPSDE